MKSCSKIECFWSIIECFWSIIECFECFYPIYSQIHTKMGVFRTFLAKKVVQGVFCTEIECFNTIYSQFHTKMGVLRTFLAKKVVQGVFCPEMGKNRVYSHLQVKLKKCDVVGGYPRSGF